MSRGRGWAVAATLAAAAFAAGFGVAHWLDATPPPPQAEREVLYWVAPMDKSYRRDKPGKSPMGMDLVPVYADEAEPEREVLYWVAPMDKSYRRDKPGKSPMGMDLVPVYADEAEAGDGVRIDPAVVHNLGVRSVAAKKSVLERRIETVGYVEYDEDTMQHIHARVEGWIESLAVQAAGDPVTQGQTLFEIYSPTLVNAQREYLAAKAQGVSDLQAASRERLAALGMPDEEVAALDRTGEPRQRVRIPAPVDGVATQLGVREGHHVTPATRILSIAELNRVWVLAEVFERQAAWVAHGQRAEVWLEHRPGERWQGAVDYVYPELDPRTRTLKVRIAFANPVRTLRPNMFARVALLADDGEAVVHIPRQALIRGGDFDRVAVELGEGRYRSVRVVAGMEAGDRVEVREGLNAGQRVVVSGQFLIDSESNLASALARSAGDG